MLEEDCTVLEVDEDCDSSFCTQDGVPSVVNWGLTNLYVIIDIAELFTAPCFLVVLSLVVQDVLGIIAALVEIVEVSVEIKALVDIVEASVESVEAWVGIVEESIEVNVDDVLLADITGDVLATVLETAIDGRLLE